MADKKFEPTWFKNVAKSLGYAGFEVAKSIAPATMDTFESNREFVSTIRTSIKEMKTKKSLTGIILKDKAEDFTGKMKSLKSNIASDLKSGKIYNKERSAESWGDQDVFGDFDFDNDDFSFDDDLSDSNFDDGSGSSGADIVVSSNITQNNPMVKAINTQSEIIGAATEEITSQNAIIADVEMKHNSFLIGKVHNGMESINANLASLVNFNSEQMSGYVGASLKYYEESIRSLNSIVDEIKKITNPQQKEQMYKSNPIDDIFGGSGGINLGEYFKQVKKQLNNALDNSMLGPLKAMFSSEDMLQEIIDNPLGFIPKAIIEGVIPQMVKKSIQEFDKSLENFFPAILSVISDWSSWDADTSTIAGKIKSAFGSIFGISEKRKTKLDVSNYEKGRVEFDGITRKSIVEVIPGFLSKIYSALTGKKQQVFDHDRGIFREKEAVQEEYDKRYGSRARSSFESYYDMKYAVQNDKDMSEEDGKRIQDLLDKLFVNIAKSNKTFNYRKLDNENQLKELLENASESDEEYIRKLFSDMSNSKKIAVVGDQQRARRALREMLQRMETDPANSVYHSLFNNTFDGSEVGSSLFNPKDSFGNTTLDYLHDIRKILLQGVITYPRFNQSPHRKGMKAKSGPGGQTGGSATGSNSAANRPLGGITDEEREKEEKEEQEKLDERDPDKQKNKLFTFSQFFKDTKKQIFESFDKGVNKATQFMHDLIFGKDSKKTDGSEKKSFFERFENKLVGALTTARDWIQEHFFDKIIDGLFGDQGFFTKMSNSELMGKVKGGFFKATDYIFGTKGENGERSGGLASGVYNEMRSMWSSAMFELTGVRKDKDGNVIERKETSVFGEVKKFGSSVLDSLRTLFFGNKTADESSEKGGGLLSGFGSYFKEGAQSFVDLIFGKQMNDKGEYDSKVQLNEVGAKIKEKAPKAIAGGIVGLGTTALIGASGFGILGSMFLGPMSGLVIGIGASLASQSDRFKDWLFGKMDPETNERVGGVISKSTQQFLGKNKGAIIGGGIAGGLFGAAGGLGVLGSIFGGPLTGAALGMTASMLVKSETFQEFLFGKTDKDGNKIKEGIVGKIKNSSFTKKLGFGAVGALGGAGIGTALSSMGLLGSVAFGPLSGAIIGAVGGIALAANKWKDSIFGKYDKDGNKVQEGLLNKIAAGVTVNVLQPLKLQAMKWSDSVQTWFEDKIAEPFLDSLTPLREEMSRFKDRMFSFFDSFKEALGVNWLMGKLKDTVSSVGKAITGILKKSVEGVGKVTGFILKQPFKALNFVANKILMPKHMREGIANVREAMYEEIDRRLFRPIKEGFKSFGESVKTWLKEDVWENFIKKEMLDPFKNWFKEDVVGGLKKWFTDTIGDRVKGAAGKAKGRISNFAHNKLNIGNYSSNEELMSKIISGDMSTRDQLWYGAQTFIPFSSVRQAAKYTKVDREDVKARLRRQYTEDGREFTEEELDNEVNKKMRRWHGGAFYREGMEDDRKKRKEEREKKQATRRKAITELEEKLKANKGLYGSKSYDELTDEEKESLSMKEFNKIIDKHYGNQYGKAFKDKSQLEKDQIKQEAEANKAAVESKGILGKIYDLLSNILTGKSNDLNTDPNIGETKTASQELDEKIHVGKDVPLGLPAASGGAGSLLALPAASGSGSGGISLDDGTFASANDGKLGESESEDKAKREARADEEEEDVYQNKVVAALHRGNEEQEKQGFEWSSIFGKKGLITAGLIVGIPLLLKFLKDPVESLKGLGSIIGSAVKALLPGATKTYNEAAGLTDEDGDRTDASGNTQRNDDMISATLTAGSHMAGKTYRFGYRLGARTGTIMNTGRQLGSLWSTGISSLSADQVGNMVGSSGDEIVEMYGKKTFTPKQVANLMGTSVDDVVKTASSTFGDDIVKTGVSKATGTFSTIKNAGKSMGTEVLNKQANAGLFKKFKSLINTAVKKVVQWAKKLIPNIATNYLDDIAKRVAPILTDTVLGRFVTKIAKFIGKAAVNTSAAALTAGATELGSAAIGAGTGATAGNAANLFQVPQDEVDGTMRVISSAMNSLLSTTVGSVIAIIDDILEAVTGQSFTNGIAHILYRAYNAGNEEKLEEFEKKIASFDADYQEYTLIDQLARGNVVLDEDGKIKYDENGNPIYKKDAIVESKASYNDRVNKTVGGKIMDAITKTGLGRGFSAITGGRDTESGDYMKALEAEKNLKNAVKQGLISEDDPNYKALMENIEDQKKKSKGVKGVTVGGLDLFRFFKDEGRQDIKTFFKGQKFDEEKAAEADRQQEQLNQMLADGTIKEGSKEHKMLQEGIDELRYEAKEKKSFSLESGYNALVGSNNVFAKGARKIFNSEKYQNFSNNVREKASNVKDKIVEFGGNVNEKVLTPVKEFFSGVGDSIKTAFTDIWTSDNIFSEDYFKGSEDNGKFANFVSTAIKVVSFPIATIVQAVKKITGVVKKVIEPAKIILSAIKDDVGGGISGIWNGSINVFDKSYWEVGEFNDGTPFFGMRALTFYASRALSLPIAGPVQIIRDVVDGAKALLNTVKSAASFVGNNVKTSISGIWSGEQNILSGDYWTAPEDSTGIQTAGFYATKLLSLPIALPVQIIRDVVDGAKALWNTVKSAASYVGEVAGSSISGIWSGEQNILSGDYWTAPEDSTGIQTAGFYATKALIMPIAIPIQIIRKVVDGAKTVINGFKSTVGGLGDAISEGMNGAEDAIGTDSYFEYSNEDTEGIGGLNNVAFMITRAIMLPVTMIKNTVSTIVDKVKGFFKGIKDAFSGAWDFIVKGIDKLIPNKYKTADNGKSSWDYMEDDYKDKQKDKETEKGGGGDPEYARQYIEGYNAAKRALNKNKNVRGGIGGAAGAAMLKNYGPITSGYYRKNGAYHGGFDLDAGDNVEVPSFTDGEVIRSVSGYAPDTGYVGSQDGGGFGNHVYVQDSNGNTNIYGHLNGVNVKEGDKVNVGTKLGIQGHTGSSTGSHLHYEIRMADGSANPVPDKYLEGYDEKSHSDAVSGSSESSSSSDVTSTGLNKINDALSQLISKIFGESGSSSSSDTSSSDSTSGELSGSETTEQIWNGLKNIVGLNEYGAAGIMGCWDQESSNNPKRTEGDYLSGFPGYDASEQEFTNFTTNVLFPAYSAQGLSINRSAYKGYDGAYYPGLGLAQWTGPRKDALRKFAKQKGTAWYDLKTQLEFTKQEFDTTYSGVKSAMENANSVTEATRLAYNKYEGGTREDWFAPRNKAAQNYFDLYSGGKASSGFKDDESTDNYTTVDDGKSKSSSNSGNGPRVATNKGKGLQLATWGNSGGPNLIDSLDISRPNIFKTSTPKTSLRNIVSHYKDSAVGDKIYDIFEAMLTTLKEIATNTAGTKQEVVKLNDATTAIASGSGVKTTKASTASASDPMYEIANNRRKQKASSQYEHAKLIASGI